VPTVSTRICSRKDLAAAIEPREHLTVPVEPTAGEVQLDPAGADRDWNRTFAGSARK